MVQPEHSAGQASPEPRGSLIPACLLLVAALLFAPFARAQTPPATPPAAATPAAPEVIKIGVLTDNPPFSYKNSDGTLAGFAVDLLAALERTMDLRLERHYGTTDEINTAFEQGRLDALQSYAHSPERETFADFTRPYLDMNGAVFVRKGAPPVHALADLRGRRVMVHSGSKGEHALRAAGLADTIVHVASVEEALRLLDAGQNDAALAARLTGLSTARRLGLRHLTPVGPPCYQTSYSFAVRKDRPALRIQFEEGLQILRQPGGAYEDIHRKWFGRLGGYSRRDILLATTIGLSLALLVTLWALLRQRTLRLRIKRQAAALRLNEERYRTVFEGTREALLVLQPDPAAPGDYLLEQANPAALALLHLPSLPKKAPRLRALLAADEPLCRRIHETIANHDPAPVEHERPPGSAPQWLRLSTAPIGPRHLVVLADITEAKKVEQRLRKHDERLRQHQKIEAIGAMASGIAHDFNNILTSILGYADLTKLKLPPRHPCADYIDEILSASDRARKLVRQILTFSRRQESHREIARPWLIIKETLRLLRATVPKTIEVNYAPAKNSAEIDVDPTQLHQVVLNLCTNAMHAIGEKSGRIDITEDLVELGPDDLAPLHNLKPGPHVHIAVRDTGCGMPPEVLQHIFEPFYTTKAPGEGTGLGLSVVHGIMRSHGGDITVQSRPGLGTTFHLYFPVAQKPAAPPLPVQPADHPRGRGERILLIDDEPSITEPVAQVLQQLGYEAAPFNDPAEAVAAYLKEPGAYQAILCDITMPRMNGIQVAEIIGSTCPFILMSVHFSEQSQASARELQVSAILEKPIRLADLAQTLSRALGRNGTAPPLPV